MSRNIVLLSDGTGNSAAKVWRTNVWRTFEALDLSGDDQVAFYDDGVGTSSFKPLAILGGAFGFGLKRNVIDIYKFACRNYRDQDDRHLRLRIQPWRLHDPRRHRPDPQSGPGVGSERSGTRQKGPRRLPPISAASGITPVWHIEDLFRAIRDLFLPKDYDKADNRPVGKRPLHWRLGHRCRLWRAAG